MRVHQRMTVVGYRFNNSLCAIKRREMHSNTLHLCYLLNHTSSEGLLGLGGDVSSEESAYRSL
jgi:hypothetical protein